MIIEFEVDPDRKHVIRDKHTHACVAVLNDFPLCHKRHGEVIVEALNRLYRSTCKACHGQGGFDFGRGELRCWDECEKCKGKGYIL